MSKEERISNYHGSKETFNLVAKQIKDRFGDKEVKKYNPYTNCLTYNQWFKIGYKVKKGSKALKSLTFIKVEDEAGNIVKTYPKTINLFYYLDTEKI
jgi:hypothetical protein